MAPQDDFNQNYQAYVLYYCNFINNDPTIYNDLTTICNITYNSETQQIELSNWLILAYPQPSNATLIAYNLVTVNTWYNNFYNIPALIIQTQPYKVSSAVLSQIRTSNAMIGMTVYDTTAQAVKYWSGTSWGLTGMYPSSPSILSVASIDSVNIIYAANTPRLIPITGFTSALGKDFGFNSATGLCTYTGSTTKQFKCTIQFSYSALALAATIMNWISKNGSLVASQNRIIFSFLLLGPVNTYNAIVSCNFILAQNDTLQLCGSSTAGLTMPYQSVSYNIEQI